MKVRSAALVALIVPLASLPRRAEGACPTTLESCLGDDYCAFRDQKVGCTANDVLISSTSLVSVDDVVFNPDVGIECVRGENVKLVFNGDLQSNSRKERHDIGAWIKQGAFDIGAIENGDAASFGTCAHFYFDPAELLTPAEGDDGDECGDIGKKYTFKDVTLLSASGNNGEVTLLCQDQSADGKLDAAYCVSWKVPGGNSDCPVDTAGTEDEQFREGTLPSAASKCRCGVLEFNILVVEKATLVVRKDVQDGSVVPNNDGFIISLNDAGGNPLETATGGDETETASHDVLADGTTEYTVSETGANLADYDTSIACTYNNGETELLLPGVSPCDLCTSLSPIIIDTSISGKAITCVITNVLKTAEITVMKEIVDFSGGNNDQFEISVGIEGSGDVLGSATGGNNNILGPIVVPADDTLYNVFETAVYTADLNNYDTSIQCTDNNDASVGSCSPCSPADVSLTRTLSQDDVIQCVIWNVRKAQVTVVKYLIDDSAVTNTDQFNIFLDSDSDPENGNKLETVTGSDGVFTYPHSVLTDGTTAYYVGETAVDSANLNNYDKSIECVDSNNNDVGDCSDCSTLELILDETYAGKDVTCTITNERKTAQVQVVKIVVDNAQSAGQNDQFGLFLNHNPMDQEVEYLGTATGGDGTAFGPIVVPLDGTYEVYEEAHDVADLNDYETRIECTNNDNMVVASCSQCISAMFTLTDANRDDLIDCVITNERKPDPDPSADITCSMTVQGGCIQVTTRSTVTNNGDGATETWSLLIQSDAFTQGDVYNEQNSNLDEQLEADGGSQEVAGDTSDFKPVISGNPAAGETICATVTASASATNDRGDTFTSGDSTASCCLCP